MSGMTFRQFTLCYLRWLLILPGVVLGARCIGLAEEPADSAVDGSVLEQCLTDLASPVFAERQNAVERLKLASSEQIKDISAAIENHPDNEVVRRLIEILEIRYDQISLRSAASVASEALETAAATNHWFVAEAARDVLQRHWQQRVEFAAAGLEANASSVASESLETAARSNRWFVSEAARDVLKRHWQRRVELAVVELVRKNVPLSPTDPTILWKADPDHDRGPFGMRDPMSNQVLKIFVKRNWPTDPRAFELLKRLEPLRGDGFLTQPTLVSIYLIDGHPLSIEEAAVLKGLFGDTRIAERGRVCLGVLNEPRFGGDVGIFVGNVQKDSSAADAGIQPGDLILGLNGEKLNDFDDLVIRLRKFDVGDKITLQVRSTRIAGETTLINIEVMLKDWQ